MVRQRVGGMKRTWVQTSASEMWPEALPAPASRHTKVRLGPKKSGIGSISCLESTLETAGAVHALVDE